MNPRVIPEWDKSELDYVEPTQVVRSFGYDVFAKPPGPQEMEYLNDTVASVFAVEGPVAAGRVDYPDPAAASAAIKARALELGARLCGIATVDPYHVYAAMNVPHRFAVMVAVPMEYDEIRHAAGPRHLREVLRIYAQAGKIATGLATFIRERSYPARAHSLRFEQINMIPHAIACGLGELGKHGSMINRALGCSFRLSAVTTDLPLAVDAPVNHGVEDFCANCSMCVNYCPGDAIIHEKQDVRGIRKWVVETEKCAPYWGSYDACGICLAVCPFNSRGFDGRYKASVIDTIKSHPKDAWRAELAAGLQTPWHGVERPAEPGTRGWRNDVRGKGASAILMQGIPQSGLPEPVYDIRALMGIDPRNEKATV